MFKLNLGGFASLAVGVAGLKALFQAPASYSEEDAYGDITTIPPELLAQKTPPAPAPTAANVIKYVDPASKLKGEGPHIPTEMRSIVSHGDKPPERQYKNYPPEPEFRF